MNQRETDENRICISQKYPPVDATAVHYAGAQLVQILSEETYITIFMIINFHKVIDQSTINISWKHIC